MEFTKLLNRNPISTIALDGIQTTLGSFLRTLLQILLVVVFCRPKHTSLLHLNHNLVLVLGLCLLDEVLSDSLLFFRVVIYSTPVLGAPVISLPVECGWVHPIKKHHQ